MFPEPKNWGHFYEEWDEIAKELSDEYSTDFISNGNTEYSIEELKADYVKGKKLNFEFFWGHQPSKSGKITHTCFSQWWKCEFSDEDEDYNCAEQYMMAYKALLFKDDDIYDQIMQCDNPKRIKALGRKIRNFDEDIWNKEKYSIILNGNYLKFNQNKELRDYLLSTDDKVIAEASPYDGIWGIKMGREDSNIENPLKWRGENLLGFALMEVRDELKRIYKNYNIIGNLEE